MYMRFMQEGRALWITNWILDPLPVYEILDAAEDFFIRVIGHMNRNEWIK